MPENNAEKWQQAKQLRAGGRFKDALFIYRELYEAKPDEYNAAGKLHCLRKLDFFDEAIPFSNEIIVLYPESNWCRTEFFWTQIQGILAKKKSNSPISDVIQITSTLLEYEPEGIARKIIVFSVLKAGKNHGEWEVVKEWTEKISPEKLSTEPMKDSKGNEGWSDQSLWYNYRINALLKTGNDQEAFNMCENILDQFPKQKKFFLRLKAKALLGIGKSEDAERIYDGLCKGRRVDSWLLSEQGMVKKELGKYDEALPPLMQAAYNQPKIEMLVKIFVHIAGCLEEKEKYGEARDHLILSKLVRESNKWTVPSPILSGISRLTKVLNDGPLNESLDQVLNRCRDLWAKTIPEERAFKKKTNRKSKKDIQGTIKFGPAERRFCFITTQDSQSIFCYKLDLPKEINSGDNVVFDMVPSFDKKKNRESWKAINVKIKE